MGNGTSHHPRGGFPVGNLPRLGSREESLDCGPNGEVVVEGREPEPSSGKAVLRELEAEARVGSGVEVVEDADPDVEPSDEPFNSEDATVDDGREDDSRHADLASVSGGAPTGVDVEVICCERELATVVDEEVPLEPASSADRSGKR